MHAEKHVEMRVVPITIALQW